MIGASGEVGKHLLAELVADEARWPASCEFHVISRRPLPHLKKLAPRVHVHVVDMSSGASLEAATATIAIAAIAAFSCVAFSRPSTHNSAGQLRGGTIGKVAFRENELPNGFARACLAAGVRHLGTFSGQGLNPEGSGRMLGCLPIPYGPAILKGMGERERDLAAMGFESVGIVCVKRI